MIIVVKCRYYNCFYAYFLKHRSVETLIKDNTLSKKTAKCDGERSLKATIYNDANKHTRKYYLEGSTERYYAVRYLLQWISCA